MDASGSAYVTGGTHSSNFPTTAGAFQTTLAGGTNAYVSKLDSSGSALVYSTYLGGSGYASGRGIAVDASGNAYVTGDTNATNFPTLGAFQTTLAGSFNVFVSKLNSSGSALIYSTYLGGSGGGSGDVGFAIAVDASGSAYATGYTDSIDFPTTNKAFQTTFGGGYDNAFVSKLNNSGSALVYSTYLGGSGGGAYYDVGLGIAVDASGSAYVTGQTYSSNFPTTLHALQTTLAGSINAFVSKLNGDGSALVYSTYLGGSNQDSSYGIAVDMSGNAYVGGPTNSSDFPTTADAAQRSLAGGYDAFVSKLNSSGSALLYSTYLGGSGDDFVQAFAGDGSGNAYITGYTYSTDFPTTANAIQKTFGGGAYDAFVSIIAVPNTPVGSNVMIAPTPGTTLTFATVAAEGKTTVRPSSTGPTPPTGFSFGDPPVYYDITTDATYSPPVTVCFNYNPASYLDPSLLTLWHFDKAAATWANVTTSNDTANGVICGSVQTLSPFALGVQVTPLKKDDCKNNRWQRFTKPSFKNQGQCVSFVNHN